MPISCPCLGRIAEPERQSKKLIEAARFWARGDSDDGSDAVDDAELLGIEAGDAEAWMGVSDEPEDFLVWPENWQTVQVFIAMSTQWYVVSGMAGDSVKGLNYAALPAVYEGLSIRKKDRPDIFAGLQQMEWAALKVMARQRREEAEEDEND
jgi:hypothetical protein